MATYIVLANFTDQGIRHVKATTKRADAFRELAKLLSATVKGVLLDAWPIRHRGRRRRSG